MDAILKSQAEQLAREMATQVTDIARLDRMTQRLLTAANWDDLLATP